MLAILLATASAVVWGTADYAGGRATRRFDALAVVVLSKLLSLPVLAAFLLWTRGDATPGSLAWGAAAGMIGVVSMVTFYRALAQGAMAVVAPVSAVTAAVVPLAVGLVVERAPGGFALLGIACAIAAIGLVSLAPRKGGVRVTPRMIALALASGVGFGMFFVLLRLANLAADGAARLWPVAAAQLGALLLGGLLLAPSRWAGVAAIARDRGLLRWVALAGVLDMAANALYLLAVLGGGLLGVVGPLSSLYPVSTVLLALLIDRERIRPVQLAGLGLAAAALVLVAA